MRIVMILALGVSYGLILPEYCDTKPTVANCVCSIVAVLIHILLVLLFPKFGRAVITSFIWEMIVAAVTAVAMFIITEVKECYK